MAKKETKKVEQTVIENNTVETVEAVEKEQQEVKKETKEVKEKEQPKRICWPPIQ